MPYSYSPGPSIPGQPRPPIVRYFLYQHVPGRRRLPQHRIGRELLPAHRGGGQVPGAVRLRGRGKHYSDAYAVSDSTKFPMVFKV